MDNQKTSFWTFLSSTEKCIVIPVIQRDYAQGREGKEYVRKRFLASLFEALHPKNTKTLTLDFVYGSEEDGRYYPLDGQQRLTTLWLLHWYLALITGCLNNESVRNLLMKFSYETRQSSTDFCKRLCEISDEYTISNRDRCNGGIVSFIEERNWYYSYYSQDPTIKAMLVMLGGTTNKDKYNNDILDGIEEFFLDEFHWNNRFLYWARLTDGNQLCPIQFFRLNMKDKNMPLTDDLYIKMNARGKTLTDYENFKADLLSYTPEGSEEKLISENTTDEHSFALLLDTQWTDFFWNYHSSQNEDFRIDEIYFEFINRFFLTWYMAYTPGSPDELGSSEIVNYLRTTGQLYQSIDVYRPVLRRECLADLQKTLTNLSNYYIQFSAKTRCEEGIFKHQERTMPEAFCALFMPYWTAKANEKPFYLVPKYITDDKRTSVSDITPSQRFVAYGICRYFGLSEGEINEISLKAWIRFLWNMAENSDFSNNQLVSGVRLIANLEKELGVPDCSILDIENLLSHADGKVLRDKQIFGKRQLVEEILKAQKIAETDSDNCWRTLIHRAENMLFLRGGIGFLFNDADNNFDNWEHFETKLNTFLDLFDSNGLKKKLASATEAKFISYCDDYWAQLNYWPKVFSCDTATWRDNILLKSKSNNYDYLYAKPIHHLLLKDVTRQLDDTDCEGTTEYIRKLSNSHVWDHVWGMVGYNVPMYIRSFRSDNKRFLYTCGDFSKGLFIDYQQRDRLVHEILNESEPMLELMYPEYAIIKNSELFWGPNLDFVYEGYKFRWTPYENITLMEEKNGALVPINIKSGEDSKPVHIRRSIKSETQDSKAIDKTVLESILKDLIQQYQNCI